MERSGHTVVGGSGVGEGVNVTWRDLGTLWWVRCRSDVTWRDLGTLWWVGQV